jgi:glyoxalase family protein
MRPASPKAARTPVVPGAVHHLAFAVSRRCSTRSPTGWRRAGSIIRGRKDRGFMDSIYFTDPLGLLIELACYRFDVPEGHRVADVMIAAHRIRVAAGASAIGKVHIAAAIEQLTAARDSLSQNSGPG